MLKRILGLVLLMCSVIFNNAFCAAMGPCGEDDGDAALVARHVDMWDLCRVAHRVNTWRDCSKHVEHMQYVSTYNDRGETVLTCVLAQLADSRCDRVEQNKVISFLLKKADVTMASNYGKGFTPLTWAMIVKADCVKEFAMMAGAEVNEEFLQLHKDDDDTLYATMLGRYKKDIEILGSIEEPTRSTAFQWYETKQHSLGRVFDCTHGRITLNAICERMTHALDALAEDVYEKRDWKSADLQPLLSDVPPVLITVIGEYAGCGGMYSKTINSLEERCIERNKQRGVRDAEHDRVVKIMRGVVGRIMGVGNGVRNIASAGGRVVRSAAAWGGDVMSQWLER